MTSTTIKREDLPTSVRGAPAELRQLIRKKQNSESARRCRLRRKLEAAKEAGEQLTTAQKMARLEQYVANLHQRLVQTQQTIAALIAQSGQLPFQQHLPTIVDQRPILPPVPTTPTTPTTHQESLQLPVISPTLSQHTMSDTDSTIRAAQELESENLQAVNEPVEVGSPFSDIDFMPPVAPAPATITDELMFYGASV